MEERTNSNAKSILSAVLAPAFLLLIPLVAMQSTDEVNWGLFDFLIMGILLLGISFTYVFVARKIRATKTRVVFGVVLAMVFFIIWAELAVGVFGAPFAGQ